MGWGAAVMSLANCACMVFYQCVSLWMIAAHSFASCYRFGQHLWIWAYGGTHLKRRHPWTYQWLVWFPDFWNQSNVLISKVSLTRRVLLINSLGPIADISIMRLSASWCHFRQCPWDLGSAWAERAGQGEVGGCTQRVQTAWPRLGSCLEATLLALGGPFLSFLA